MAVYEPSRALSEGVRINPTNMFTRAVGAFMNWNDRRATRNALQTLTAKELDDIGLNRDDINNI